MNYFILTIESLMGFFKEIVFFPIWWYTKGALKTGKALFNFLKAIEKYFALRVWIKNIFKPMYAQYDLAGMVASFIVRTFQIIMRGSALIVLAVICFCLFLGWLALPALAARGILMQI